MGETTASSIFSHASNRVPGDTVFYSIYPDFSLTPRTPATTTSQLQSLHLQILKTLDPYTSAYIFHHQPFTLSLSSDPIPHLHGRLRFGHNLDDEWFVLSLLLLVVSSSFPRLSVAVSDSDGEFLLIESAFHLPRWLNPDTAANRLFLRQGHLHLIPTSAFPSTSPLSLRESLSYLITNGRDTLAGDSVQNAIRSRIRGYPEAAIRKNSHRVRIRVPLYVAQVLRHEPNFISLAVEGFYDRDVDSMKYGAKMERFLGNNKNMVRESAKMTRAMYAQLVQQRFQAPKCYPMPGREKGEEIYTEAELGMKVAVGFEMMYQVKKSEGEEGKGETWEAFRESLERSGYFQETIPGSKEYRRLMENAEEYYRNSSLFSRASEMMSAPVRRIDEILALPHSADDFMRQDLPPSDDDSWLYSGEDELNAALLERQKEMDLYNSKYKRKQKSKEQTGPSSGIDNDGFGLGEIAKSMQAFVQKMSSYEGAEVPKNRNLEDVDFDVDRFMKDMESAMGCQSLDDGRGDVDIEEGSSSDMDFDESDEESDQESLEAHEGEDIFMHSYSDVMDEQLKSTTLHRSFVRAQEQSSKEDKGTSNSKEDVDEQFTPVDVDVNLVKSLLDSFSSQEGLPGPASNLLGLMGLRLPQDKDAKKDTANELSSIRL